MRKAPRILPLVGVALGGVLALKLGATALGAPDLFAGAKALAEGVAAQAPKADAAKPAAAPAQTAAAKPAPVCAPTAAELAKEAGLSPAELRVLQSLGERRDELQKREDGFDTQAALIAAAEAKLDAKVKRLEALKADIDGLLHEADTKTAAETLRMVKVYESMKPKDAAARITLLDDAVRLPIAEKMKERSLAAVLAQMPPAEAKKLTESLAKRYAEDAALTAGREAIKPPAAQAAATPAAGAPAAGAPAAGAKTADAGKGAKPAANAAAPAPAKAG